MFCMQVWGESLQQLQARVKKVKANPEGLQATASLLTSTQARVTETNQQAWSQVRAGLREVLAAHGDTMPSLGKRSCSGLWSWQRSNKFDAESVFSGIAFEQALFVRGLAGK